MNKPADLTDPVDVRDILGLRNPETYVLVALVVVAMAFGAAQLFDGLSPQWPAVVAVAIMAATTIAVVTMAGDPLPLPASIVMALAPPVATSALLAVVPTPLATANQVWVPGYAVLIYVFMCMRGRTLFAWMSVVLTLGVHAAWAAATHRDIWDGSHTLVFHFGALLAVTLIARAMRSTTATIIAIRTSAAQRAAALSAVSATQEERADRLAELDALARPLLDRIATGVPLSADERLACEVMEAHLRDQLRAPDLTTAETAAAARAARLRGVEVMLIDDGGLSTVSDEVAATVRRAVTATLEDAIEGEVRIRVMPHGRTNIATIYRHGHSGTTRIDITPRGVMAVDRTATGLGRSTEPN